MKNTFRLILQWLAGLMGKKIIFLDKKSNTLSGKTAVKSKFGFWYVGNVFDSTDIAYGIMRNGLVEKKETELVIKILNKLISEKNITFYDIGANTGYYGVFAAHLNHDKIQTLSFEPIVEYTDCIKETAKINNLDNVQIFSIALGNENKTEKIQLAGSGSSLNPKFNDNNKLPIRKIIVKKLDDVIKEKNLNLPDFIKIDVEGYEYEVLQGGLDTIKKSLPILFIEIAYSLKNLNRNFVNKNYEDTFKLLSSLGYQAYLLDNNSIKPYLSENKKDGVNMYLFLHNKHKTINNLLI